MPLAGLMSCLNLKTRLNVGGTGPHPFLQVILEKQQPEQGAGGGYLPAGLTPFKITF